SIFKLHSHYKPAGDQPQAISGLINGLKSGHRYQTLLGVTGSGKTYTMANVISHFNKPVLVIAPNKALAAQLYREYKNFFPENSVNYFVSYYDYYQPEAYMPSTDTYIGKESMINEEIDKLRHKATTALLSRRDVIIVASVSCIYNLGVPVNYLGSALHLTLNQVITRGDLLRQLVKIQFKRTNGTLLRGYFRARGDVFEIMPASGEHILKIEISDQKIKSLYFLDPLTRHITSKTQDLAIFPPKHFISNEPQIKSAIKEIGQELKERLIYFKKNKLYLEAERLQRRTKYDMEMMKSLGYCHGIENYSRSLSGKLAGETADTLLSYFPLNEKNQPDFLTIIDESHISVPQVRGMYAGDQSRKKVLVEYGWRLPSALDNRPLKFDEFEKRIGQTIFTSATPSDWEIQKSAYIAQQIIRPTGLIDPPVLVKPVFDQGKNKSQVDDVILEAKKITEKNERMIINVLTKKMAEDLCDFLKKKKLKVQYMHSDTKTMERTKIITDFRRGRFNVLVGVNLLREGLDLPEVTLVAILDADREGFLRSETSLIQTMGRASRNVSGKIILYADIITGSIERAMKEVDRRREVQKKYNQKHHINPLTIKKDIEQLLD
ncbi:MAG: excinuclease ABC subunit UvrB, partial [Candidatus Parcubacteria bacterium]|nr:excinuclease ABC subunit UvrB [Candidatus Parcubacteria bacterium]